MHVASKKPWEQDNNQVRHYMCSHHTNDECLGSKSGLHCDSVQETGIVQLLNSKEDGEHDVVANEVSD